jgi:hypothetical protein
MEMNGMSRRDYLRAIWQRYHRGKPEQKSKILDEFCRVCGYNRKYAIWLLGRPRSADRPQPRKRRGYSYGHAVIQVLASVWEAAGYPWSVRLKALLPLWLPWIRRHYALSEQTEQQLLRISPRQIDRRLQPLKNRLRRRLYGRTKPGTLLKHHVPIKADHWNVSSPGFTEIDLVSHSGPCAEGEFAHSFNVTDIHTTWTETRAVLGKGQTGILRGLEEMRQTLPFQLQGIDSDNGSEFLNDHLVRYCRTHEIQFTRGRPYKKDDNAHIEQKNWTHVRKLIGWDRFDTPEAVELLNDLYRNELRIMMNLFQPSVKLIGKERVGSRLRRIYDAPQTPLDRLRACREADKARLAELLRLRATTDPFLIARSIEAKIERLGHLATRSRHAPPPERFSAHRSLTAHALPIQTTRGEKIVALRASRAGSCPGATSAAASCSRATGRSQSGRGSSRTR